MDLNDKIKRQELLIEDINKNLDSLLGESAIGLGIKAVQLLLKGKKVIPKIAIVSGLKKLSDLIIDKEKEISSTDLEDRIKKLEDDISKIESLMSDLEKKRESQLQFKKIHIQFNSKVSLDIESMKSPEFKRNLLGTMYFKVIDINEEEKYLLLKTNLMPDTQFIKLKYGKLELFKEQKGEVSLLYSRYKNPLVKPVEGDSEDSIFKIVEMS